MNEADDGAVEAESEIVYLSPGSAVFSGTDGGFVGLKHESITYPRVHLRRTFPLTHPGQYISVRDEEGNEIGLIEELPQFSRQQQDVIERELERRYFTPTIEKINSIKDEFGYYYFEAETSAGPCRFTVQRSGHNLIVLSGSDLIFVDVDGNRFQLFDYERLKPGLQKQIEALL